MLFYSSGNLTVVLIFMNLPSVLTVLQLLFSPLVYIYTDLYNQSRCLDCIPIKAIFGCYFVDQRI